MGTHFSALGVTQNQISNSGQPGIVLNLQIMDVKALNIERARLGVPTQIANPRGAMRNTLVGGVLGLVLSIMAVITLEWWRTSDRKQPKISLTSTLDKASKG